MHEENNTPVFIKKNKMNGLKAMAITAICLAALGGCGTSPEPKSGYSFSDDVKPVVRASEDDAEKDAEEAAPSAVQEPVEKTPQESETGNHEAKDPEPDKQEAKDPEPDKQEAKNPESEKPETKEPEMSSVEGVARLGDLLGLYQMDLFYDRMGSLVVVDTESAHNPYDLTWRYGSQVNTLKRCLDDPEWDTLYRSYVDACDWSLVFDADHYKNAFPMLAKLYHDDALLLEHFQTQGVHEGRQANADFNVAAYMENCGKDLMKAFGDNYECYYFYYMLNNSVEKSVSTANTGNQYPLWLTVELSLQQSREHSRVNEYRTGDGVGTVEVHPELVALANYRAWYDAEHNLYGHDYCFEPETINDLNDCFDRVSLQTWSENTDKWYHTNLRGQYFGFYCHYRLSESHNEAMTRETQRWSGYSNPYLSDNPGNTGKNGDEDTGYCAQFDIYSAVEPKSPWNLY